jgi:drug/metabolite transporter (DMT)-like permease
MASPLHARTPVDDAGLTRTDAAVPRAAPRPGFGATDLSLLLMALIWGVNYTSVKYGTGLVAPLAFNGVRVTLAALSLVLVAQAASAWFGIERAGWPNRRDAIALFLLGTLGNGVYQILFVEGIARTRAGDAALLIAAAPAFMALIGRLRGTERAGPRAVVGIALSLAGIALVVFGDAGGGAERSVSLLGDGLLLCASLCWALYSVLLKPYTERVDGIPLSAVTMIGGAVPLLIVSAPELSRMPWQSVGAAGWGAVAYSGLLALALAYLFWYRGVRVLGPTRAGMYSNLQPVFALGVAWATLHEAPRVLQIAGAVCILAGLLLTRMRGATEVLAGE